MPACHANMPTVKSGLRSHRPPCSRCAANGLEGPLFPPPLGRWLDGFGVGSRLPSGEVHWLLEGCSEAAPALMVPAVGDCAGRSWCQGHVATWIWFLHVSSQGRWYNFSSYHSDFLILSVCHSYYLWAVWRVMGLGETCSHSLPVTSSM